MTSHVPVRGLFETHLTVRDLPRSMAFYHEIVGLPLALAVPERNAAFFWIGDAGRSMLGLWSLGSAPMGLTLHLAFEVGLDDLLDAPTRLTAQGITPLSFDGAKTKEPSVLGWMPAAAVYFHDPDGHLLEYLTMLDEEPRPDAGIIPWSVWRARRTPERTVEHAAGGAEARGQYTGPSGANAPLSSPTYGNGARRGADICARRR